MVGTWVRVENTVRDYFGPMFYVLCNYLLIAFVIGLTCSGLIRIPTSYCGQGNLT